jgi:hypothetical protein
MNSMSEKKLGNEISTEEKIKILEAKVDKVESLLGINFLLSLFGCVLFIAFIGLLGFFSIIFIVFFAIYGILNLIILMKNKQESPNK